MYASDDMMMLYADRRILAWYVKLLISDADQGPTQCSPAYPPTSQGVTACH